MQTIALPRLKDKINTERISVAVPPDLKKELETLRFKRDVNVSEWIRLIIRRELNEMKAV